MKNLHTSIGKLICLMGMLWMIAASVHAQSPLKTWDGGAGNALWSSANNWNPNAVPVAGDSVVLDHRHLSGDYTVTLPNTAVTISCLRVYPSSPNDSIFVLIPTTNNITSNFRVTATGYHALRIGNRGRLNNMSGAGAATDVIRIDGIANHGMLLDTGGYYYHSTLARDTMLLRNLSTRYNSTFEYDKPSGSYTVMIFPPTSPVGTITFHHLIMSGRRSGSIAYGGTLANNWSLVVNGDLTVRDNASFGLVRGAFGQNRTVYFRGNITSQNTSNNLWFEASSAMSFGWYVVFDGTAPQTIQGDLILLDRTTINNPSGLTVNDLLEIKPGGFAAVDPSLVLTNGVITTQGAGEVFVSVDDPTKLYGHPTRLDTASTAASYINGVLRRAVLPTGIYEFPVGTASNYELCVVNFAAMTGVNELSAQFLTTGLGSIPIPLSEGGFGYNTLLNRGYWRLTPDVPMTGGTYTLSLYETGYTNGGANNYRVVRRTNSAAAWAFQGNHQSFREKPAVTVSSRSALTGFSEFAIASPPGILPVGLTYFEASQHGTQVLLEWGLDASVQDMQFTVERSRDQQAWAAVQHSPATSTSDNTMFAWDGAPLPGNSFYRLRMVDAEGLVTVSKVCAIARDAGAQGLSIWPNPVHDLLHLAGSNQNAAAWRLFDLQGKLVPISVQCRDPYYAEIDLSALPGGCYFLLADGLTYKIMR